MFLALNIWIVGLPTTLAIAAVVGISVALSLLALVLVQISTPHRIRRAHNDVSDLHFGRRANHLYVRASFSYV